MISVTILVKDGERCLKKVLEALQDFEEIIVVDTGSKDRSLEIAKNYSNVSLYQKPFKGFGFSKNEAAYLAKNEWILSLDADEILSSRLAKEILSLPLDESSIYSLTFFNYFNGKHIKWCGWHPESHIRLYNKKKTAFSETRIHEGILKKELRVISLKNQVHHYPYASLSDFLVKMERYSTLFAEEYKNKRKSSPLKAIFRGFFAFFKSYVLKKGILGGFEGFIISIYNGHTTFYKYLKLYMANRKL